MYLCIPCYNQVLSLLRSDLSFSDSRVEAERLIIAYRLVRNCNYPMTKQRKQFLKFIIDSLTKSFVTSENALFLLKKIKQIVKDLPVTSQRKENRVFSGLLKILISKLISKSTWEKSMINQVKLSNNGYIRDPKIINSFQEIEFLNSYCSGYTRVRYTLP